MLLLSSMIQGIIETVTDQVNGRFWRKENREEQVYSDAGEGSAAGSSHFLQFR